MKYECLLTYFCCVINLIYSGYRQLFYTHSWLCSERLCSEIRRDSNPLPQYEILLTGTQKDFFLLNVVIEVWLIWPRCQQTLAEIDILE